MKRPITQLEIDLFRQILRGRYIFGHEPISAKGLCIQLASQIRLRTGGDLVPINERRIRLIRKAAEQDCPYIMTAPNGGYEWTTDLERMERIQKRLEAHGKAELERAHQIKRRISVARNAQAGTLFA